MSRRRKNRDEYEQERRLAIITPLLPYYAKGDPVSKSEYCRLRKKAAEDHGISERTVQRYIEAFKAPGTGGIKALKPKHPKGKGCILDPKIVDRAIELRREAPLRSVYTIIQILVQEKVAKPGEVKRSTLQDALARRGYSRETMRLYDSSMAASSRFEAARRNELWQGDIKYGPIIIIDGVPTRTYLSVIIDDYSRHIIFAKFYVSQEADTVADSLKEAVTKYGVPEEVYFDNGKMYVSKLVARFCQVLGIQEHHAPPYRAQAKGCIERFIGTTSAFFIENEVDPAETLDDLNYRFQAWLKTDYEQKVHSETHQKPEVRYMSSRTPLNIVGPEVIRFALMREETRKVDGCGDFSFNGNKFHAGKSYAKQRITILYDDSDLTVVYMENKDGNLVEMRESVVGRYVEKPKMPEPEAPVKKSHYLRGLTQEQKDDGKQESIFDLDYDPAPVVKHKINYSSKIEED